MTRNGHDAATDELERDIASERAALRRALDTLNETGNSTDTLARDVLRLAGIRDDDLTRVAVRTVRENPGVSAVTGAGLAWLLYRAATTQPSAAPSGGRIDDTIETLREALKSGTAHAGETLRDTYDDAKATAERVTLDASRKAQKGAADLADSAREHPVATAAIAIAAAAALAGLAGRSASQATRPDTSLDGLREENRQLRQLIAEALGGRQ